jgi:hypothetical protein
MAGWPAPPRVIPDPAELGTCRTAQSFWTCYVPRELLADHYLLRRSGGSLPAQRVPVAGRRAAPSAVGVADRAAMVRFPRWALRSYASSHVLPGPYR